MREGGEYRIIVSSERKQIIVQYKFKYWDDHTSTGLPVTKEEKNNRAFEIAEKLCNNLDWLTHGRSITLNDLKEMKLIIEDYSEKPELCEAIRRYYTLLRIAFDNTSLYKVFETPHSQIYKHYGAEQVLKPQQPEMAEIEITCNNCGKTSKLLAAFKKGVPLKEGVIPFPHDNIFICPACNSRHDISALRMQLESQTKQKLVQEFATCKRKPLISRLFSMRWTR